MRYLKPMVIGLVSLLATAAFAQSDQKPMPMNMDCKAMMEKHEQMQANMKQMDERLQQLVRDMNAARGSAKVDRMAAVVNELVAQRTQMREHMATMMPQMMQHMMAHMQSGMMRGMSESMAGCPMADHSEHH